jgi:hypothetical protein
MPDHAGAGGPAVNPRILHWLGILLPVLGALAALPVLADKPVFQLDIRNHLFWPAEISVPANMRFRLEVSNRDATPEEFESYELNREKVIMGEHVGILFIGPLAPGEYPYFGEFHPNSAQGRVIAK